MMNIEGSSQSKFDTQMATQPVCTPAIETAGMCAIEFSTNFLMTSSDVCITTAWINTIVKKKILLP